MAIARRPDMSFREDDDSFNLSRRQCLSGIGALALAAMTRARAAKAPVDLRVATAVDLSAGLRAGQWSAREIAQYYLGRIDALNGPFERFDANGALNAYVRTFPELARKAWERADRDRTYKGWAGVPVTLKDVYAVAGMPLTVGTPAFKSYRPDSDCTLWREWSREGAALLGHTQAQRFISGITTPQTGNPWNPQLIVGGSSGGTAAAVAGGLAPVGIGGETNGSLIYPALCCAVTTLKPSLGLLSLARSFPGVKSFDVAGPLAHSAADCAWVLATLAGVDPEDSTTAEQQGQVMQWPDPHGSARRGDRPFKGLRFLVAPDTRYADSYQPGSKDDAKTPMEVDARVKKGYERFLRSLTALGAEIVHVSIPEDLGEDGIFNRKEEIFGNVSARSLLGTADWKEVSLPTQYRWLENAAPEEWEIAVKWYGGTGRRLESDKFLSEAAYVNPQTVERAKAQREELRRGWEALLDKHRCDAHVYLEVGSPLTMRKGIDDTPHPHVRRVGVRPNDLGWPVLSMPVSKVAGLDVPISAQIMGRRWHDHRLLGWGMEWQQHHPEMVRLAPRDPKF